jgi:hypothetical protein
VAAQLAPSQMIGQILLVLREQERRQHGAH